jgi:hypothetical protein
LAMISKVHLSLFLDGRSMDHTQELNLGIESGALIALGSRVRMNHDLHARISLALKQTHRSTLITALDRFRITEGFSAYRMVYEPTEETAERLNKLFSASDADELKDLINESWDRKSTSYTGTCWPIEYAVAAIQFLIDADFGLLSLYRQSDGDLDDAFMWNPLTWYLIGKRNAIKDSEVREISKTLVELLSVAKKKIRTFREIVPDIRAAMEMKLRRKKKANPLLWFVRSVIDSMSIVVEGFPDAAPTRYCPFAEVAKLGKVSGQMRWHFRIQPLTKSSGFRLLHVLSSYSQTHKHKEYALKGRLSMYVAKKGGIVRDTDIAEVAILLDGKWSASEVAVMASSGIKVFSISDVDLWSKWVAGN